MDFPLGLEGPWVWGGSRVTGVQSSPYWYTLIAN